MWVWVIRVGTVVFIKGGGGAWIVRFGVYVKACWSVSFSLCLGIVYFERGFVLGFFRFKCLNIKYRNWDMWLLYVDN